MTVVLQQTLKSLCYKTGWCYAVFWKLKRRSRMVLTWEDGYYEHSKPSAVSNFAAMQIGGVEQNLGRPDGGGMEDQIGLAVAKMSYHVYSLGEGIIGHVAFTGKHQWVFENVDKLDVLENHGSGRDNYPIGWSNQFTAGIKTIAVVAVPQGVVQLGSNQLIMEDLDLVGHIRGVFGTLQSMPEVLASDFMPPQFGRTSYATGVPPSPLPPGGKTLNSGLMPGQSRASQVVLPQAQNQLNLQSIIADRSFLAPSSVGSGDFPSNIFANKFSRMSTFGSCVKTPFEQDKVLQSLSQTNQLYFQNKRALEMPYKDDEVKTVATSLQLDVKDRKVLLTSGVLQFPLHTSMHTLDVEDTAVQNGGPAVKITSSSAINNMVLMPNLSDPHRAGQSPSQCQSNSLWHTSTDHVLDTLETTAVVSPGLPNLTLDTWENENLTKDVLLLPELSEGIDCDKLVGSSAFESDTFDIDGFFASLTKECTHTSSLATTGSQFAMGDELSEALAPVPKKEAEKEGYLDLLFSPNDMVRSVPPTQTPTASSGQGSGMLQSTGNSSSLGDILRTGGLGELFHTDVKPEPLLDAVVAGVSVMPSSLSARGNIYSRDAISFPLQRHTSAPLMNFELPQCLPVSAASSSVSTSLSTSKQNDDSGICQSRSNISQGTMKWQSSMMSAPNSWVEQTKDKHTEERALKEQPPALKTHEETTKNGKKRARPGEPTRPRPKDRQQIQDRVRELREIVPNATKCSIDALLERTIKHMNFLQSVTQHGGKWKSGELKGLENGSSLLSRESLENGASWAFEWGGGQGMGCPIVVENLSQPRQMLVEMLCEEKGLFLEIADNIRGLGLTILKGVMEARADKIWARFIVEAIRETHRVEILWSLMQLLQPNSKTSSTVTCQSGLMGSQEVDVCPADSFPNKVRSLIENR